MGSRPGYLEINDAVVVVKVSMSFDLQDFMNEPAHFNITVNKHGVEKEIKDKVQEKLIELQILPKLLDSVQPVAGASPVEASLVEPGAPSA